MTRNTRPRAQIPAIALLLTGMASGLLGAQGLVRTEIRIPDIPGFRTLKCDFHMHTVFSDGRVWPTVTVEELWRRGYDAFAITDHVEYQPHQKDVNIDQNRSYQIAAPRARQLGLTIIRGAEITRPMPPGHFNALFLKDAKPLHTENWRDAIRAARKQGAFIFWNHPSWTGQQPDGIARWYEEHTELCTDGSLHGIEVVNGPTYCADAHRWCLEKKLTLLANSDLHDPVDFPYPRESRGHRPATLVFAKDGTIPAIREALGARRTALYFQNTLIGEARFLRPIFEQSVRVVNPAVTLRGRGRRVVRIRNDSDLPFQLARTAEVPGLSLPRTITLSAGKTVLLAVRGKAGATAGRRSLRIPFKVLNLKIAPERSLPVELALKVTILEAK